MLRALALELGVGDRIRWAGRVEDAELLDWYAAADVFVLPSSSEAQGIVALEAMAAGLPVVASAVGGLLGTIDDGQSGFLVPAGEVEPLAERLAMLLADSELRRRLGGAARRKVETDFTWGKAAGAASGGYQRANFEAAPKRRGTLAAVS